MIAQWYTMDRHEDPTGISGTGIVAYVLELDSGLLVFWNTTIKGRTSNTMSWFPDKDILNDVHGHDGATVLTPLLKESDVDAREPVARILVRVVIRDVMCTLGELTDMLAANTHAT